MTNSLYIGHGMCALRRIFPVLAIVLVTAACAQIDYLTAPEEMRKLWQRADAGDTESQYGLGIRYTNGISVAQNYGVAVDWFRKAAMHGHVESLYMLGMAYYVGRGVPRNHALAAPWLQDAAEKGHIRAMYQLGDAFANGRGVDKNLVWAARWYGKAAMRGHRRAQYAVGVAHAAGQGTPVNLVEGWILLRIAEKAGHSDAAKVRRAVAKKMTAAQLHVARRRATAWRADRSSIYADTPTVRFAQIALSKLGFRPGPADGVAGAATHRAVRAYRREAGLPAADSITPAMIGRLRMDLAVHTLAGK